MSDYTAKFKWLHPYGFRSGEWSTIIGVIRVKPHGLEARLCFKVIYDDGIEDLVPICEQSSYEIKVERL